MRFAYRADIVEGDEFFGRDAELEELRNSVVDASVPISISVVGLPGSGKSSLCHNATRARRDELLCAKRLPLWLSTGEHPDAETLLKQIAVAARSELAQAGAFDARFESAFTELQAAPLFALPAYLKSFFRLLRERGYTTIVVLDEFDYARKAFRDQPGPFQTLRELTGPETRIGFIIASRRQVSDIEASCGISHLDRILRPLPISSFNAATVEACRAAHDATVSDWGLDAGASWACVARWAGAFPYLLVQGISKAVDPLARSHGRSHVAEVEKYLRLVALKYFRLLMNVLDEDRKLREKLLGYFFGPPIAFPMDDKQLAEGYGLITSEPSAGFTLSQGFRQMLETEAFSADLWPLWRQTEQTLRRIVTRVMVDEWGDRWHDELEKKKPALVSELDARATSARQQGAAVQLLDYTYPGDLAQIVFLLWSRAAALLGDKKVDWERRINHLSQVRNAEAHNRPVSDEDRMRAEEVCKLVITIARKHKI